MKIQNLIIINKIFYYFGELKISITFAILFTIKTKHLHPRF